MTSARLARLIFAAALTVNAGALAQQTPRMSYQESSAIKRSMLPPGSEMRDFELDHCRPLCLGGSNDRSNLQLQPWPEARRKDDDEVAMCKAVSRGELTQEAAAEMLARRWPCDGGLAH
jgi:hypothetical protein